MARETDNTAKLGAFIVKERSHIMRDRQTHTMHLLMPRVQVVQEGQEALVRWTSHDAAPAHWQLAAEDGCVELATGELHRSYQQAAIALPAGLAPGYYRLRLDGSPSHEHCRVIVAPRQAHVPSALRQGERWWGCTIQLYALRSARTWGIGDFGDLRRLCDAAAHQGASFIGLSPLHALFPHRPETASPYSPSSRKALNPIYLDVQTLVDLSGCDEAVQKLQSEAFQESGFWSTEEGIFLIVDDEDRLLGTADWTKLNGDVPDVEIGYRIFARSDWGKGIASEALNLLSGFLFDSSQINRLRLTIHVDNHASRRVAEKCGFRCEARSQEAWYHKGKWHDVDVFVITRPEAEALRARQE